MPDDENRSNGNTPIDVEEVAALVPTHITKRGELNQWEALNIARAEQWIANRAVLDPLSTRDLQDMHRRMFDQTWFWAGSFRRSDKNISPYHWSQVPVLMEELTANTKERITHAKNADALDDVAIRFHHELVRIHPWPNGNGRHARLATDLLLRRLGRPAFTWGGSDLASQGLARERYIKALRAADATDYGLLRAFVRS